MSIRAEAVLFSYLDRPIFDVIVGATDLGVSGVYPNTGGGTMSGARFSSGAQSVRWTLDGPPGMSRNGDVVQAKNQPDLSAPMHGEQYLSVHIYPDDTVEIIYSKNYPQFSPRGLKFMEPHRPTYADGDPSFREVKHGKSKVAVTNEGGILNMRPIMRY